MKIAVALSGGVDSSVVAKLLVDEGHEVIGLHLRLWADPTCDIKRENKCCDMDALNDARLVSAKLGIPFYVIDAKEDFKREVVDYFIGEYKNLRTPNPCIKCNDKIKFDLLLKKAMALGCEKMATGHYARAKDGRLFAGADKQKDQSYMLYQLNKEQLSKVLFPLADMQKEEVRNLAVQFDLHVKEKSESQEICFVSDKNFREFLKRYLPEEMFVRGEIVSMAGKVIGEHEGLINYTIGQRKGFNLSNKDEEREPLYVIGLSKVANQLIVGNDEDTFKERMTIANLHLINPILEKSGLKVKVRYRHPAIAIKSAKFDEDSAIVEFAEPVRAITPGQSAVFYKNDEVLGGGVITQ